MARASGWLLGGILLAALVAGCRGVSRPGRHLVLVGSRSMVPLVEAISRRFEEGRPDVRITVEAADSERAINDTRLGLADLGLLARDLGPLEAGLRGRVIARDGVAFLVQRDSPVRSLSQTALSRLLTREYTSWQEVGGAAQAPLLLCQGKGRSLRDFLALQLARPPEQIHFDLYLPTGEQVVEEVTRRPQALGCLSLGVAEPAAQSWPVRPLSFAGVSATLANLRSGRYPLARPLLLLTRREPGEETQQLLDFACSPAVHDLVLEHGFALPRTP